MLGNLPECHHWVMEEPDILKPEPAFLAIPAMASQHMVIDILFFDGILHE